MIKKIIVIFILVLFLINFSGNVLANENNNSYFTTLEGKLIMSGSDPFVNVFIRTKKGKFYSLSGEYVNELKKLTGAAVRLTGLVTKAKVPGTRGDINLVDYKIIKPKKNIKKDWVIGKIYHSENGYVLIDKKQIIYELKNINIIDIENLENTKLLLYGEIEYGEENFEAEIDIEGYNVIKIPQKMGEE